MEFEQLEELYEKLEDLNSEFTILRNSLDELKNKIENFEIRFYEAYEDLRDYVEDYKYKLKLYALAEQGEDLNKEEDE